jgi:aryl-alcohol dehydrogenase-like predicted oxidoreductase
VERDLIPMAETLGLGVVAWSPLAGGVLTGKYGQEDLALESGYTRKAVAAGNGFLTAYGLEIAEVVKEVAAKLGTTPSRVALAWTLLNSAVVAPIVGARTLAQLDDNLGVFGISLQPEQRARLAEASAVDLGFPHESLRRLGYTS